MDETLTPYETIGSKGLALKGRLPGMIGQEATDVFVAEQAALRAAGLPTAAVQVGDTVDDARLVRADGSATSLSAEQGDGPAVLVFYRGAWCPFCNIMLRTYQTDLLPALEARDVRLLAVSAQKPERADALAADHDLGFPVLADPANALARTLGITMLPSDAAVERLHALGSDMVDFNVDGTREIPYPTVVVVDAARRVHYVDVHVDYSMRTEPADVLLAVDGLLLGL